MKLKYETPSVEMIDFRAMQVIADIEGDGATKIEPDIGSGDRPGGGGRPGGREG